MSFSLPSRICSWIESAISVCKRIVVDLVGDAPAFVLLGSEQQPGEFGALLVEAALFGDILGEPDDEAGTLRLGNDARSCHDRVHRLAIRSLIAALEHRRRRASRQEPTEGGVRRLERQPGG